MWFKSKNNKKVEAIRFVDKKIQEMERLWWTSSATHYKEPYRAGIKRLKKVKEYLEKNY